jgi:hypothetical protein
LGLADWLIKTKINKQRDDVIVRYAMYNVCIVLVSRRKWTCPLKEEGERWKAFAVYEKRLSR